MTRDTGSYLPIWSGFCIKTLQLGIKFCVEFQDSLSYNVAIEFSITLLVLTQNAQLQKWGRLRLCYGSCKQGVSALLQGRQGTGANMVDEGLLLPPSCTGAAAAGPRPLAPPPDWGTLYYSRRGPHRLYRIPLHSLCPPLPSPHTLLNVGNWSPRTALYSNV